MLRNKVKNEKIVQKNNYEITEQPSQFTTDTMM